MKREVTVNEVMTDLTQLLVLAGARPYSNIHELPNGNGMVRDLEFYFITKPDAGQNRKAYTWTMNSKELSNLVNLQIAVNKIDEAFDLPFDAHTDLTLSDRIAFVGDSLIKNYDNDLTDGQSVLNNSMPRAKDANWITDVYGELMQELDNSDEALAFRKFDYDRTSLKEVLVGKIIDAERVKAEGFVLNSNFKNYADKSCNDIRDGVHIIENMAKGLYMAEKGE